MSKNKKTKKTVITTTITEEVIELKTLIVSLLDMSYSMNKIMQTSIDNYNEYLSAQKNVGGDVDVTIALFDDHYELIEDKTPIKDVKFLNGDVWYPRGMTALYDAIGKTINSIKKEKYDRVLFCIVTDGNENDSKEFNSEDIKAMISEMELGGWTFIFLAANQDAMTTVGKFGIRAGNTLDFSANEEGMGDVSVTLNKVSTYYRDVNNSVTFGDTNDLVKNLSDQE